jgi:hypothetical protein
MCWFLNNRSLPLNTVINITGQRHAVYWTRSEQEHHFHCRTSLPANNTSIALNTVLAYNWTKTALTIISNIFTNSFSLNNKILILRLKNPVIKYQNRKQLNSIHNAEQNHYNVKKKPCRNQMWTTELRSECHWSSNHTTFGSVSPFCPHRNLTACIKVNQLTTKPNH